MVKPEQDELAGRRVRKHFKNYGYFLGTVTGYFSDIKSYRIKYDDGDVEDISKAELRRILQPNYLQTAKGDSKAGGDEGESSATPNKRQRKARASAEAAPASKKAVTGKRKQAARGAAAGGSKTGGQEQKKAKAAPAAKRQGRGGGGGGGGIRFAGPPSSPQRVEPMYSDNIEEEKEEEGNAGKEVAMAAATLPSAEATAKYRSITRLTPCAGGLQGSNRYSQSVVYGGTCYLAGQTARDTGGEGGSTYGGQARQVFEAIDAHLAKAGTSKARLLSALVHLKDIQAGAADFNAAWEQWIDQTALPVRTSVQAPMIRDDFLVEVTVVAAMP